MKPKTLEVATDYRLALLWLMDRLGSATISEATAAFGDEFGSLVPAAHREANNSGRIKWEHYVAWSRFELVRAGLMGSSGRGVWTIAPAGKAWLRDNPNADHADLVAFIRQASTEGESSFEWRGERYRTSRQALLSRAGALLAEGPPKEALRFKDWAVVVGEQPVSVKWLFALVTNAGYNEFDSPTARRALSQIGIEAVQIGKEEQKMPVDTAESKRSPRLQQRDAFLEKVVADLAGQLPRVGTHGKIVFTGTNYLQVRYPELPSSHYELRVATKFDEVAFHLEGERTANLARLAEVAPRVDEFSRTLNQRVIAEPWSTNWARLAIDLPSAPWTGTQAAEYASLLSQFIEVTLPHVKAAFEAVTPHREAKSKGRPPQKSTRSDSRAYRILEEQLAQIQTFLRGRSSRPSDEVLCDWVQFCYTFEQFDAGYELFRLIEPGAVNEWFYARTKRLAQVCRIRAQHEG